MHAVATAGVDVALGVAVDACPAIGPLAARRLNLDWRSGNPDRWGGGGLVRGLTIRDSGRHKGKRFPVLKGAILLHVKTVT